MARVAASDGLFEVSDDGTLRLIGGYSATSGQYHFPLSPRCPYSGADDVEQVLLSNSGTLWGFTTVTIPPPGYRGEVPYGFGVVELTEEQLLVVGRLTEADADKLDVGMDMHSVAERVYTDDAGDDVITWAFAPGAEP